MLTASQRRTLDRRLGEELGFNPHGEPNFRWVHTSEMFFFVKQGSGMHRRESGLMVWEKKWERKPWSLRYGLCWILAKWNHYSEEEWHQMVGTAMPYPKSGDWVPCENIRLGPDYPEHAPEPNLDATMDAIHAVQFHRTRTAREFTEEPQAAHDLVVKGVINAIGDELHDLTPAFGKEPGTHSGSTEFMN